MSETLRQAREKSRKRKQLLGYTLGSSWAEELGSDSKKVSHTSQQCNEPNNVSSDKKDDAQVNSKDKTVTCPRNDNESHEFRDSTAFLKGTQSLNPHNDYSQNFVDTGQRPQNFIRKFETFCPCCQI